MPKDPFSNVYLDRHIFFANLCRSGSKDINLKLLAFFRREDAWIQSQLVTEQYPLVLLNQSDGTRYASSRVYRHNGELLMIGSVLEVALNEEDKKHHIGLYNYEAGHLTLIAREEDSGPPMVFLENIDP
ncbi:hypothetical protein HDU90_004313 [Geranomyces variabilis]|nr:hypothetical protein HDU90_004313 [Geranomyces variabilis]